MTKTIKLFLASSNELKAERNFLKSEISTKNKALHNKGIYLHLDIWEDESEKMSATRSQDEYNKLVKTSDIFICLAFTKVGKYTREEFEIAYQQFKATGQPNIIVYFKKEAFPNGTSAKDLLSLEDFENYLSSLKHFPSEYKTQDGLWIKINNEIDRYIEQLIPEKVALQNTKTPSATIPKLLTQPPFQTEYFIGREDDLARIHHQLFQDDHLLLLVNGKGGMGKTTIAARYFRTYTADYQHLAWIFTGKSLLDALLTLAIPLQLTFDDQMPNEARLKRLLHAMANLEKPCLLVIDNANDVKELDLYYKELRSCPNFHLLLTTRITEFDDAICHKIEPLSSEDRLRLFKHHYSKLQEEEHELLKSIITAVGNNTLVIELLAKNLRQFNRLKTNYSLTELWKDLQSKGLLAIKGKTVRTSYQAGDQLRTETPENIIAAMYDLNQLSEQERQLLSIFAVLPAENIPFTALEDLLSEFAALEDTLLQLAQSGWLELNENESAFKVSPVVQEIVQGKNVDLFEDCELLLDALIEKLDYEGTHLTGSSYEAAVAFARYSENILATDLKSNLVLSILCERVGVYYRIVGNLNQAIKYSEQRIEIAKRLLDTEPTNEHFKNNLAIAYEKLGTTQSALGNLQQALSFFEQYKELEKELHTDYPQNVDFKNGLAIAYSKLGNTQSAFHKGTQSRKRLK